MMMVLDPDWLQSSPVLAQLLSPSSSSLIEQPPFLCFFLDRATSLHLLLLFGDMSSFSSASNPTWPVYGPVSMTRCPDCPRTAPLKRLTLKEHKKGDYGREFVKCESRPEGQILNKCNYFEWMVPYIQRLQGLYMLNSRGDATRELNQPSVVDNLPHDSAAPTAGDAELKGKLKKMNKNLRQLIELKKQSNLIALGILALGFFYLMVISR
ncbi:hypothetical protein D1007_48970 [Hordeum vulgare]|nr:hypothetical protein D1007_48970 [Hordeum vulgare]